MHTELTLNLVRVDLNADQKPVTDDKGQIVTDAKGGIVFQPNPSRTTYIVFDDSREAPKGFAVKVGVAGKTFLIQMRNGSRVIKTKIGNIREFNNLKDAYLKGFEIVSEIRETGRNPNTIKREKDLADMTLDEIFTEYTAHLETRAKPATENSLIALKKARQRLACWKLKRVSELTSTEILEKFAEMKLKAPTATEQTFRWASSATSQKIKTMLLEGSKTGVVPHLSVNPFDILVIKKMYRSRNDLENAYRINNTRNPLELDGQMGAFINTLWDKRPYKHTGTDYLLFELLWGCRKSEHRQLQWKELVPKKEIEITSWVDLKEKSVFFHTTKNGSSHLFPIAPMAHRLLTMRQEQLAIEFESKPKSANRKFVFPAQSKNSKTGQYNSPKEMLESIMRDAGIEKITPHDLRRTFGRVAESLNLPEAVIKNFLNHSHGDVTTRYTKPEWKRLSEHMERIEQTILSKAPRVFNALRPLNVAPMIETKWEPKPYRKIANKIGRPKKSVTA